MAAAALPIAVTNWIAAQDTHLKLAVLSFLNCNVCSLRLAARASISFCCRAIAASNSRTFRAVGRILVAGCVFLERIKTGGRVEAAGCILKAFIAENRRAP